MLFQLTIVMYKGSFLEFEGILSLAKKKYSPSELPYHLIVPSLPGYGYSSGPSLKTDWRVEDIAVVIDNLMVGLGFGDGYISQGGDIGSFVTRILAAQHDSCKGAHRESKSS